MGVVLKLVNSGLIEFVYEIDDSNKNVLNVVKM